MRGGRASRSVADKHLAKHFLSLKHQQLVESVRMEYVAVGVGDVHLPSGFN